MSETKSALIIANYRYEHPDLRQLTAPAQDAESLARVLADPNLGGFEVRTLVNETSPKVNLEIENFCDNRKHDDLLLIYFSGHGIKDADGQLYFATVDTQLVQQNVRRATAVSAQFVNVAMSRSRSRRQILLLDCCYSGAFKQDMLAKGDKGAGAGEQFGGQGRIVLTASDALQYSFEGGKVAGESVGSVFTRTLVQGLETGEADLDRDGFFSLDEVYDYVYGRVADQQPEQKPTKMGCVEGRIFIGSNPHPLAANLPPELLATLESPLVWVRAAAVQQLATLLDSGSKGLAIAAQTKLVSVATHDDSQQVRTAAANCLASRGAAPMSSNQNAPAPAADLPPRPQEPGLQREQPEHEPERLEAEKRGAAEREPAARPAETERPARAEPERVQEKTVARSRVKPQSAPGTAQAAGVLNLGSGKEPLTLRGHKGAIWSVEWSPDGKRLTTASDDKTVKVWEADTGRETLTLRGHRERVRRVAWNWNPDANWLATASTDGWWKLWDADTGKEFHEDLSGGEGWVIAWTPKWKSDGNWLAHSLDAQWSWDGSGLGGVMVHFVETGDGLILHHRDVVRSIAWSPDGVRIATGTIDGTVRVWKAEKGKELLTLRGHSEPVTSGAWDPDGSRLATASEDGSVRVWNTQNGKQSLMPILAPQPSKVWSVAWGPYGNRLAAGMEDKTARVWDASTGKELMTLSGHGGAIRSVAWSPDGKRLATAGSDKTAKVWDIGSEP